MAMPWLRHRLTPATPRTSTKATLYMRSIRKNYSLPVPRLATLVRCTTSSYSTFFEVLGVSESASLEEVKAAFRAKSKLLHPDVNNSLTAARDFMLLRRAYKTLSTHELRTQYEAKLGMPSARAHDPRFARFERWRCEVIPDLRIQLDVWSRSLDGYLTAWRASVAERERSLGRLYSACLDSLRQLHQLQQETHPTTQDYVYQYPPLPQQQQRPPDARLCPEPDPLSRASAASGDFFVAPPGNFNINGSGSGWSSEFPVLLECVEGMFQQMAAEVAGIAADSGDGTARVDREVEKRYQQVSMRYPAYPDIVWMDVWEETAELWKAQGAAEAERCAESGKIWSERLQQLKGRLHAMAPAEVIIQVAGAGTGRFNAV
ncbi:hypothetical protein VaNZ11_007687 [Volvox africanus]|uniref:J domain-containing protein n=1 Tax=Volvox africanus TaxID=51714 RepID=A0ABQ5S3K2_9CHLO|nr:hypothetical protein VaNZ11_007687 [Volvox africanus]